MGAFAQLKATPDGRRLGRDRGDHWLDKARMQVAVGSPIAHPYIRSWRPLLLALFLANCETRVVNALEPIGGPEATGDAAGISDAAMDVSPEASTCAGYALVFDGSTFATVARMVDTNFTVEAWIKTTEPSLTGTMFFEGNGVIYADFPGTGDDDFGTAILNNHFSFGVGNPDTTIESVTEVTTGQWFHVAATRNATTGAIQVFVLGNLEADLTLMNRRPLTAQSTLTLGGNTIDSRYFKGTVDEVRIWNVVRSAVEIKATMNQLLTGNETGLVAYWRFDEPGARRLLDSSSAAQFSASLSGGAAWVPSDAPVCPTGI
jgi:hypothetical protein